ncbi:MAG: hypothetical protein OEZ02_08605 [Anaerolineae bacterium]|nr:hypothetical protein [Anaerolineae bacterium]
METIVYILRKISAFVLSALAALAAFGLLRGALWLLPFTNNSSFALAATLVAAVVSVIIGGAFYSQLAHRSSLAFGMLFGFISFMYINGLSYLTIAAIPICGLLAEFGGRLTHHKTNQGRKIA